MYGNGGNGPFGGDRQAKVRMPSAGQMGGTDPNYPAWIQRPMFPTAPFVSTNPGVGRQIRYYRAQLLRTDADYNVGTESLRNIQFDLPCRVIAINAAAIDDATPALLADNGLNTFSGRVEYTTGDKLHVASGLASTIFGTAQRPGQIGDFGYNIDQGASVVVGITPHFTNLRIDVVFHCLEMRGNTNYSGPRYG
jgi:hypothetical protein